MKVYEEELDVLKTGYLEYCSLFSLNEKDITSFFKFLHDEEIENELNPYFDLDGLQQDLLEVVENL